MNSNNLENEKLPENVEGKAEETIDQLSVEEKTSAEPVETTSGEPIEAENKVVEREATDAAEAAEATEVAEATDAEPVMEAESDPEPEKEPDLEPKTEEPAVEKGDEINYDIEIPEEVAAETEDAEEEIDENSVLDDDSAELLSIEEIVQKLRGLLVSDHPQRREVDEVKNQFYRSLRNETESQKAAFLESGGESIDFVVNESEIYAEGKELIRKIKEKRAVLLAREDAETKPIRNSVRSSNSGMRLSLYRKQR